MYLNDRNPQSIENVRQNREVNVVSMFADLRNFSNWLIESQIEDVADLITGECEQMIQISCDCHADFLKPLGDGFLLLWEADEYVDLETCLKRALDAAYTIHNKYAHRKSTSSYKPPTGYGIGLSQGAAVRIQPNTILQQMNEIDFLGYPLNCSARMQTLSLDEFQTTVCSSIAATLQGDPEAFLYPSVPGFSRALKVPSEKSVEKAQSLKGLASKDQEGFRHLEWAASEHWPKRTTAPG